MQKEKLLITRINYTDKRRDGTQLISKNGKPFYKVGILSDKYGAEWINGLVFGNPPTWKEGESVELMIGRETFNGRESLKFEVPKREQGLDEETKKKIDVIYNWVLSQEAKNEFDKINKEVETLADQLPEMPDNEIRDEDIPF